MKKFNMEKTIGTKLINQTKALFYLKYFKVIYILQQRLANYLKLFSFFFASLLSQ